MSCQVDCRKCGKVIGYFHDSAPWGYIVCAECEDTEEDESEEFDD